MTKIADNARLPGWPKDRVVRAWVDRVMRSQGGATTTIDGAEYRLCFLSGHPRSGTHWVTILLNLHPKILVNGEYHFEMVHTGVAQFKQHPWHLAYHEPLNKITDIFAHDFVRRILLSSACKKPKARVIGDATPRYLFPLVPGCRHILLLRDPRDIMVSWTLHLLNEGKDVIRTAVPSSVQDGLIMLSRHLKDDPHYYQEHPHLLLSEEPWVRFSASSWAEFAMRDLATAENMELGTIDGKVLVVRYEDFHDDVEGQRERMYRYLGVDPAEAAPLSSKPRTTPGFRREDTRSFYRKGAVGDWVRYFDERNARWFREEAGEALVRAGYEKDLNW